MIKLTPDHDCRIIYSEDFLYIYFAQIPDLDVSGDILSLSKNYKGINFPKEYQHHEYIDQDEILDQRVYYFLYVSPPFKTESVAKKIQEYLIESHGLTVEIEASIDDEDDEDLDKGGEESFLIIKN